MIAAMKPRVHHATRRYAGAAARRAHAAEPAMPVIGFLRSTSPDGAEHLLAAFRQGLKETDEYSDIDALDLCQEL